MKRVFDIIVSVIALSILLPVILLVCLFVLIYHGSPLFFKQLRIGKDDKPFWILKFRSMTNETDSEGKLLSNDQRITKFGSLLRKTSLDELPGLLNVLKGDMSLVGPRPLLPEYLPLYSTEQRRRHEVKPGITGWAQVNGRNSISWEQKFALDVWYVNNQSLWLDIKILFMTVIKVIKSEGINESETVIAATKFTGSKPNDI